MAHTYTSDVQELIQFVRDQGWDIPEIVEAATRLEAAILEGLEDYSIPEDAHRVVEGRDALPASRSNRKLG